MRTLLQPRNPIIFTKTERCCCNQKRLQLSNIIGKIRGIQHGPNLSNPALICLMIMLSESSCRSYETGAQ